MTATIMLTAREREILQLKAKRLTNREIAETLVIAETTVKWFVTQIFNKLGATSRAEAIDRARCQGLLDDAPLGYRPLVPALPQFFTPFIGRQVELTELDQLLGEQHQRLVTIVGPGGIGKSRLATELTTRIATSFQHCWWVGCQSLSTNADDQRLTLLRGISAALDLSFADEVDLGHHLAKSLDQSAGLLIVDGVEGVRKGADVLVQLLNHCPQLSILCTSREPLALYGEVLYRLTGLPVPAADPESNPMEVAAVQLFLQSAQRQNQHFSTSPTIQPAIAQICGITQGNPLALELAATWTATLTPAQIGQRLRQDYRLLDTPEGALTAIFERSWQLLSPAYRAIFAKLSIFRGAFSDSAAQAVSGEALALLKGLVEKSLLQSSGDGYFSVHELLRQFAARQLEQSQTIQAIRERHCAYYTNLITEETQAILAGRHSLILRELDNIELAWQWALKVQNLHAIAVMLWPLDWLYDVRAWYASGERLMRGAVASLQMAEPSGPQGKLYALALVCHGFKLIRCLAEQEGQPQVLAALQLLAHLGAQEEMAWPQVIAVYLDVLPEQEAAIASLQASLQVFERTENEQGIVFALAMLAKIYANQGEVAQASEVARRALRVGIEISDQHHVATALQYVAKAAYAAGEFSAAIEDWQQAADLYARLGLQRIVAEMQHQIGRAYQQMSDAEAALDRYAAAAAIFMAVEDSGNLLALTKTVESLHQAIPTAAASSMLQQQIYEWLIAHEHYAIVAQR